MTNVKQKFVDYREGSFVDFEGKDHYFVVCAVLRESTIRENVTRILSFGVSFCNPVDKHNNELGKKIAYGKANSKKGYSVAFDHMALMSTEVANALLNNFVSRVSNDPSLAIENYEAQKEAYLKKCQKQENS